MFSFPVRTTVLYMIALIIPPLCPCLSCVNADIRWLSYTKNSYLLSVHTWRKRCIYGDSMFPHKLMCFRPSSTYSVGNNIHSHRRNYKKFSVENETISISSAHFTSLNCQIMRGFTSLTHAPVTKIETKNLRVEELRI